MVSTQPTSTSDVVNISAVRKRLQRRRYIGETLEQYQAQFDQGDPERVRIAKLAMEAPVLNTLDHLSYAWKCAITMLCCYASIEAGAESRYPRVFRVVTLEEAAECMMLDGAFQIRRSKRVYDLGAKTALHALIWARQKSEGS